MTTLRELDAALRRGTPITKPTAYTVSNPPVTEGAVREPSERQVREARRERQRVRSAAAKYERERETL